MMRLFERRNVLLSSALLLFVLALSLPASAKIAQLTSDATYDSQRACVSGDGSAVAFDSEADLTTGNSDHSREIFVMDSDGSNVRRLTGSTNLSYITCRARTSADGSLVVFHSDQDLTGGNADHTMEIFVIDSDGTGLVQITNTSPPYYACEPDISGDGSVVAFSSDENLPTVGGDNSDHSVEVWLINSDGTGLVQATDTTTYSGAPSLNGDGSWVAFESYGNLTGNLNPDASLEVFIIDSSLTTIRQLSNDTSGAFSSWFSDISADGSKVAFASDANLTGGNSDHSVEVFVVNSDGTGLTQLTSDSDALSMSDDPDINADGSVVAFESDADPVGGNPDASDEMFVINTDGTGLKQLTTGSPASIDSQNPSITADASLLVFDSEADLTGGNPDGEEEVFSASTGDAWTYLPELDGNDNPLPAAPSDIAWGATVSISVEAENAGDAAWDTNYDLRSVEGTTPAATAADRWGLTATPEGGIDPSVGVGESVLIEFDIVGPPFTTMAYVAPVGLTDPGVVDTLECDWQIASNGTPIQTDIAENDVCVSRFSDVGSGQWARYYIEQNAGRVPAIANGFPEGDFKPGNAVDRAAMAVFTTRAMGAAPVAWADSFPDVGDDHWAVEYIESAVVNDVVAGYPGGLYWPDLSVSRGQLAVFVARAKGWVDIADDYDTADELFPDVPAGFWAGAAIEACVDNSIVNGYLDDYYRPAWVVSRDQMTVFMWRAFMDQTGVGVVLAGPGTAATDPQAASYGQSMVDTDPAFAYVAVDALRLDTNLSGGATWDITFTYYGPDAPTGNVAATTAFTRSDAQITAAWTAAVASGDPYLMFSAAIPAQVTGTAGTYELEVDFEGVALGRTVTFDIS